MKINTIRLEGFKRFRDPITIDQLETGINLIAAPNGKGKSTVAEAVRVAFLERYRTASLGETLAPWSQPGATPTVQIEFERDGRRHRLAKSFGSKKSCTLEVEGAKTLTGEDAEQAISDMFSFAYSAKGVSRAENQGVPGLLWVQQGSAWRVAEQVDNAHEYISRALGDDVGELAATAGDRVIERVQEELGKLLTAKSGKPTGDFARSIEQLATRQNDLQELQKNIAAYNTSVDRFAELQKKHAEGEHDRPWQKQRAQIEQARHTLQALAQLDTQREQAQMEQKVIASEIERHQRLLTTFEEDDRAVEIRRSEVESAQERDQLTLARVRAAETEFKTAQGSDTQAREQAVAARRAASRRSHEEALAAAQRRKQELEARLQVVESHQKELAAQQAEVARLGGFASAGQKLQSAETKVSTARAKLEAVSTRLEYELTAVGVTLNGKALAGQGSRTIAEPTEIEIAGLGRIRVLPGAKDLSQLKTEFERAEADLGGVLQALGAKTADEARKGEQDLAAALAAVNRLESLIEGLAAEGMDTLRGDAKAAEGELERHRQALAALPDDTGEVLSVEAAEAREATTQTALKRAQTAYDDARGEATKAQEQLRLARQELHSAQARVEAAGREDRRKAAQADLVTARALLQAKDGEVSRIEGQIQAAQPEQLRDDIQRLMNSANIREAEHGRVGAELNQLSGALRAQGALGLQEEAAAAKDDVARLQRQVDDRKRRADALTYLLGVLTEKRAEVARSIRAPLQKHMNRYLGLHFPGASIELDEGLKPQRITRQGPLGPESGNFDDHSGGEREQLGIIARLAYADLLKEAGKPTLVILDDSLVNTDLGRLATMKRVIWDAGKRHQILILTCHGENWQDIGVAARTLQ